MLLSKILAYHVTLVSRKLHTQTSRLTSAVRYLLLISVLLYGFISKFKIGVVLWNVILLYSPRYHHIYNMTDVLPQMRHFLIEGPITKLVTNSLELTTYGLSNGNTALDTRKNLRALLPQMDARARHDRRGAALANPHTNDIPVSRIT
jgi:hypothetical protein